MGRPVAAHDIPKTMSDPELVKGATEFRHALPLCRPASMEGRGEHPVKVEREDDSRTGQIAAFVR